MANAIYYVVLILASIITVWFILTSVMYPISSPTVSESGKINLSTPYVFLHSPMIKMNSVGNATIASCIIASNFTTTTTTITRAGEAVTCENGTYTINYDYENDPTVMGTNFGFIVILLGVAMLLIVINAFKKWK